MLAAAIIAGFYYEKLKKEHAFIILALLFILDMALVDKRYLNADKFFRKEAVAKMSAPTMADTYILRDTSYFRVLNLSVSPFNDASTSYFHKSIGGYHGAKLKRYQELIDTSLMHDINLIKAAGGAAKTLSDVQSVFAGTTGLNLLNTKYVIYSPGELPLLNHNALGNAWFVESPVIVDNANEELSSINRIDPSKVAVIDKSFKDQIKNTAYPVSEGDKLELKSYKPNELIYTSKASGEKLAIFSEIYYPAGWKSFIDGRESKYFRADYVLRGMIVPAGTMR